MKPARRRIAGLVSTHHPTMTVHLSLCSRIHARLQNFLHRRTPRASRRGARVFAAALGFAACTAAPLVHAECRPTGTPGALRLPLAPVRIAVPKNTAEGTLLGATHAALVQDIPYACSGPVNTRELRDAFGAFMTGVTIVTTAGDDGKPLGFTANSFSSVSLDPALLLVSIAKTSGNYQTFSTAGHFAINILAEGQKDLSNTFARPSDDRFANVNWQLSANRNPLIDDVSAWFDCTTHAVIDAGDHALIVGRVEAFHSAGFAGLGYYRGGYFTPAKVSAEVIAGPKVIVSAIIAREDKVLLVKTADGKWGLPSKEIGKEGADKALADIFTKYQPDASASFIYSVYNNTETHYQYISFLCSAPDELAAAGDASAKFISLEDIETQAFQDSALASMLQRYRKESELKSYGMYFGDHSNGTVRPLHS